MPEKEFLRALNLGLAAIARHTFGRLDKRLETGVLTERERYGVYEVLELLYAENGGGEGGGIVKQFNNEGYSESYCERLLKGIDDRISDVLRGCFDADLTCRGVR